MQLNRIIWHHSGGPYRPTRDDLAAYHRATDGDGQVHPGEHPVVANAAGRRLIPGQYAAHCKNLNGGSIGLVICAMGGASWGDPFGSTTFPVRPVQIDALVAETARLCVEYGITPDRRFTLSHAEVELTLNVDQDAKWDFDYPLDGRKAARNAVAIGDELRQEVSRIVAGLPGSQALAMPFAVPATSRIGDEGDRVEHLQSLLEGLTIDGRFGPKTRNAVIQFQRIRELLPDGIVGPMTWAALQL
jgi:hypothetical protein